MPDICQANIFEMLCTNGLFWFGGKPDSRKYTQDDIAEKLRSMGKGISGVSKSKKGRKISLIINAKDNGIPIFDPKENPASSHKCIEEFFELFFAPAKTLPEQERSKHFESLIQRLADGKPPKRPGPWTFPGWEDPKNDKNYDYKSYENYKSYIMKMLEAALPRWHKSWAEGSPRPFEDNREASGADSPAPSWLGPAYPCHTGALIVASFTGREELLDKIQTHLDKDKFVALTGMGGIGKSALARQFAVSRAERYPETWRVFNDMAPSFQDVVLKKMGFEELKDEKDMPEEERLRNRLERLRQRDERTLMIIDNVDEEWTDISHFRDRKSEIMKCPLIITTRLHDVFRNAFGECHCLRVDTLSEAEQRELFASYCPQRRGELASPKNSEILGEILRRVGGHTQSIELIAKTWDSIFQSHAQLEEMLEWLGNRNINYEFTENGKLKNAKKVIREMLFRVPIADKQATVLLQRLAFLPLEGISCGPLLSRLFPDAARQLEFLVSRGFVTREGNRIRIHPLIRETVREDMTLEWAAHHEFAHTLHEAMDTLYAEMKNSDEKKRKSLEEEQQSLCLLAQGMCEALRESEVPLDLWDDLIAIVRRCKAAYRYDEALRLCEALSGVEMKAGLEKRVDLHLTMGGIYEEGQSKYQTAIEHYQTALETALKMPRKYGNWRGSCYKSLGIAYRKDAQYAEAAKCLINALKCYRRNDLIVEPLRDIVAVQDISGGVTTSENLEVTSEDLDVIITAQDNLGVIYRRLGEAAEAAAEFDESRKYYQESKKIAVAVLELRLALREKLGANMRALNEKALAFSHHRIGSACYRLGDYQGALEAHERSRELRKKGIAASYNWIGKDYLQLGKQEKARKNPGKANEYLKNAKDSLETSLKLRIEHLGEGHPEVAKSLISLSEYYEEMNQLPMAIQRAQEACKILKESNLRDDHPYIEQAERRLAELENKASVSSGQEKRR